MNILLKNYISRFQKENNSKLEGFFTQYNKDEYKTKLPYFFDIEIFCLRLLKSLVLDEKVCIYSDYDTDAVTATATMYWGLVDLGFKKENLDFYAPDRFTEGYGMNPYAVEKLTEKFSLIISVDCGINSTEEAEVVLKTNTDLIITDHHHITGNLPNALVVVNPQVQDYYSGNPQKKSQKNKVLKELLDEFKTLQGSFKYELIESWVKAMPISKQLKDYNFASKSLTGVGVAWLSLVWLGYFFEEIGLN